MLHAHCVPGITLPPGDANWLSLLLWPLRERMEKVDQKVRDAPCAFVKVEVWSRQGPLWGIAGRSGVERDFFAFGHSCVGRRGESGLGRGVVEWGDAMCGRCEVVTMVGSYGMYVSFDGR